MIKISVGWYVEFKSSETNIVKSFVVDTERLIRVLNKLMNGESRIVGLNDGIRDLYPCSVPLASLGSAIPMSKRQVYLGRRHDGESRHHSIREFLSNL